MNGPIAVLAGTPVDTRMGVAYLEERGLPGRAERQSAPWRKSWISVVPLAREPNMTLR